MKKLKLDDLHVDSFATSAGVDGRGTVHGNAPTDIEACPSGGCNSETGPYATCFNCPGGNGVYPSTSCLPFQTRGEATCYCLYPRSDYRVCCSNEGCTGPAGGMC
ncbi:pinensin family lanthipeptide [Longimicrobium terrae]|uniref:Uncharacterized protein n=1 Tax=Longimicrobium terrae TaxID=1639882 RepID=A0A841GW13_9BACT|nr:pinensin family lanthipeptide [Longimicrobium terrae]MBB4635704.1 hypothetical protein [Longimicrobium terrae]MBB6070098.1 hypothetical protein [Longimicrobium terrae]NNC33001.1 hypothetical protein [Longimicrobium terrae]